MTFDNISKSALTSPVPYDELPAYQSKFNVQNSFDMLYSENALMAIGTCNADTNGDTITGENIRMITELGEFGGYEIISKKRSLHTQC